MAVIRVAKTRDYTVMSNRHLRDKSLTLKAKGLLSMMLSLPDEWNFTTRGLAAICKEGVDSIGAGLKELEQAGYMIRHQLRDGKGKITDTEYVIYETPVERAEKPDTVSPCTENPDTENPDTENPDMDKPDMDKPDMDKPDMNVPDTDAPGTEKPAQSNTHVSKTYISKNQKSNPYPSNGAGARDGCDEMESAATEREIRFLRAEVLEQIDYDSIVTMYNRELLDELVELMVETLSSRRETFSISGEERPTWLVQERLRKLNVHHIEYVLNCLQSNRTKIHNIKKYLLATLFNAPVTMDNYYENLVRHAGIV